MTYDRLASSPACAPPPHPRSARVGSKLCKSVNVPKPLTLFPEQTQWHWRWQIEQPGNEVPQQFRINTQIKLSFFQRKSGLPDENVSFINGPRGCQLSIIAKCFPPVCYSLARLETAWAQSGLLSLRPRCTPNDFSNLKRRLTCDRPHT